MKIVSAEERRVRRLHNGGPWYVGVGPRGPPGTSWPARDRPGLRPGARPPPRPRLAPRPRDDSVLLNVCERERRRDVLLLFSPVVLDRSIVRIYLRGGRRCGFTPVC